MKGFLFRLLNSCGLPAVFRYRHRHSLTIVLYHGVAPQHDTGIFNYRGKFIDPQAFRLQIAYLHRNYTILPLEEALSHLKNGTLPHNALSITFDDGYRNFYEHAYPILNEYGAHATMYLATDFVCRGVPLWVDRLEHAVGKQDGTYAEKVAHDAKTRAHFKTLEPSLREHDLRNEEQIAWTKFENFADDRAVYAPLTEDELHELSAHGVSFGAHTKTHPILSTQDAAAQRDEIEGSKRDIEALGITVSPVFAYPNGQRGDWNETTETLLSEAGFTYALTTLEGVNDASTHPYRLKRIALDATGDLATFANVVSGVRLFVKSIL